MGDVIKFEPEDWYMCTQYRRWVKKQQEKNVGGRFDDAIRKDTSLAKDYLNKILGRVA